jgi:ABC-type nitrate/sulfonate/bicarbonate transport system substrate-binding protein
MKITIALDWTPNANHAGLYLALLNGWYKEAGLDVELIPPENNQDEIAPIEKLFRKKVFFAIAPSEMIIKAHQNGYKELIALAAIFQGNPSAFATLKKSGIDSIEKLNGKKYAALEIPFEKSIINQLTKDNYSPVSAQILDIYKLLFDKTVDFVWLFKNIKAVEAKLKGIELNIFNLEDAGIPYGPCSLIMTRREFVADYSFLVQKFFEVTSRAYIEVAGNPEQSAEILHLQGREFFPDKELIRETIKASCAYYLTGKRKWGIMHNEHWENYLSWLEQKEQIRKSYFKNSLLYNNEFLDV